MRVARLDSKLVGKQLAKTLYTSDGRALLRAGVVLTEEYIRSLMVSGYQRAYIHDEYAANIEPDELLDEAVRVKAISSVKSIMERYASGKAMNNTGVTTVVKDLIDSIRQKNRLFVGLADLRSFDDYTFGHSVNVCLLALVIGNSLYYDQRQLQELGIGALMHDIGKMLTPLKILNKPGKLDAGEFEVIRKHPGDGFDILRQNFDISLLSSHVPFEHHERCDGSGYPRGLKGGEILEYARIVAIADVYDAVTNDRVYRPRLNQYQAYNLVAAEADRGFDKRIAQRFLARMLVFPNGTIVRLSTGATGIIIRQAEKANDQPTIRVLTRPDGSYLPEPKEMTLQGNPDLRIVAVLEDYLPQEQVS